MKAVLSLVAFALFAAQTSIPNLSGRWKLDMDASTGAPPVTGTSLVEVSQTEDDVQFQYESARGTVLAEETFPTDWSFNRRFATRTQIGRVRARWQGKQLIVETSVVLDVTGEQTFSYTENWSVSPDGRTLTQKSSDGKKLVFERVAEKQQP